MTGVRVVAQLALRSLLNRRATVVLTVFSIALSVALLCGVERVRKETRSSFANTIAQTDLIVGARSGPLQLLLYSVFRLGQPTTNVTWSSYAKIAASPDVAWSIPISLGDSHRGYRVLGTTSAYLQHYRYGRSNPLTMRAGRWFEHTPEVVLGARVAADLGYGVGQQIVLSHGLGATSFTHHDAHPMTVTGVLQATGTPVDQVLHVSLEAIDILHAPAGSPAQISDHDETQPASITAFFLGLKSRTAALGLQRAINTWDGEAMTAVIPGVALQELWSLVRAAEQALLAVSAGVVVAGLFGMLSALLTSLNERRRELAILRAVGARPWHLLALLIVESGFIAAAGAVLGIAGIQALLLFARPLLARQLNLDLQASWPGGFELAVTGAVVALAVVLTLWPAVRAYRQSLADGLSTRL